MALPILSLVTDTRNDSPPFSKLSTDSRFFGAAYNDDEGTTTSSSREDIGILTETQLVLLCLDYLRTLSRRYTAEELQKQEGLNRNVIAKAAELLSQSFTEREDTTVVKDPSFLLAPAQLHLESDPVKLVDPESPSFQPNSAKFVYDDSHPSNRYRFFALNGLSTPPLTLGEIAASGLVGLNARSRGQAELDILDNALFRQFVDAVKNRGFFDSTQDSDNYKQLQEYRGQKVVDKFRVKLAVSAAKEAQSGRQSPFSVYSISPAHSSRSGIADPTRLMAVNMAEKQRTHQQQQQQHSFSDETLQEQPTDEEPVVEESNGGDEKYNPADVERAEKYKTSGNNYSQAGKYLKAIECYTQALQLCPSGSNSHIYYSNRSAAYLALNRYEECLDDNERALALKPDYVKAYTRMGWALFHLKEYEYAMESFEMAMKLDPENAQSYQEPYHNSREAWEKQRTSTTNETTTALDGKQDAKQDDNDSPRSEGSSTPRLIASGATTVSEENKRMREKLIDQKEANKFKSKGNAYMAQRDWVRAVEAYSTAINLCPNGPNSYVYFSNRSAALCYLEQYEEAELDAADSVALNPEYGKAYARLGLSRFFLEDYQGAVEAYENALFYDPDNNASKSYLAKAKKRVKELGIGGEE